MPEDDFKPDWISAPGETVADILEEQDLSLVEFAKRMGHTPEFINDLIRGDALITIETARKLEDILGASAAFWMIRESQYREDVARLHGGESDTADIGWLNELPLKDMLKFGWLRPFTPFTDQLEACLRFFGVPNVRIWHETYHDILKMAAFRLSPSFDSQPAAVAAWLREGEIESTSIDCRRWDAKRFQEALLNIRPLTRRKDPRLFIPELVKRCADCGVAVVIVRAPNGCRASGATRFLSSTKALLILSFRYLSDDHFWFTFFHEAGHLLLHSKKAIFLEGANIALTKEEKEANVFAGSVLIPSEFRTALLNLHANYFEVIKFARRVGVSPGIVVGQLQHLGQLKPNQLNRLKRRFVWHDA